MWGLERDAAPVSKQINQKLSMKSLPAQSDSLMPLLSLACCPLPMSADTRCYCGTNKNAGRGKVIYFGMWALLPSWEPGSERHEPRREARVALAAESDQVFAEQSLFAVGRKGSFKHTKCMSPRFFCTDGPMIGSLKPTQLSLRAVIYSFRPYSSIGRRKNPFSSVFQETPRHRT
ncbi:hypothetical protein OIU79_019513 [Salix purpurea]|uniref:Uncharacterized protein n=1 Tax=Salix purpurea TaxID=77065 RepID=A0A9Q0P1D9_SALPP|nr:hypothetical protein OIU79_019513 [Salix purpurea]